MGDLAGSIYGIMTVAGKRWGRAREVLRFHRNTGPRPVLYKQGSPVTLTLRDGA